MLLWYHLRSLPWPSFPWLFSGANTCFEPLAGITELCEYYLQGTHWALGGMMLTMSSLKSSFYYLNYFHCLWSRSLDDYCARWEMSSPVSRQKKTQTPHISLFPQAPLGSSTTAVLPDVCSRGNQVYLLLLFRSKTQTLAQGPTLSIPNLREATKELPPFRLEPACRRKAEDVKGKGVWLASRGNVQLSSPQKRRMANRATAGKKPAQ